MKNILFLLILLTGFFANSAVQTQLANKVIIGSSVASTDKTLEFNNNLGASNPKLKMDSTSGKIKYSQDGSNFTDLGSIPNANVTVKTANYTALVSDDIIVYDVSLNDLALSLPSASGISGKRFIIKLRSTATFYRLVIDPPGAETIDGAADFSLYNSGDVVEIVSDGTNWVVSFINVTKENFLVYTNIGVTYSLTLNTWITATLNTSNSPTKYPITSSSVTIRKTGRYRITCKSTISPINGETGYVTYSVNGASESSNYISGYLGDSNSSGSALHVSETTYVNLNRNDVIRLRVQVSTNTRTGSNGRMEVQEL